MNKTLMALAVGSCVSVTMSQDFSEHWHDGRAEIDGYRLSVTRYGRDRAGQAVMIFVTEPFSESKRVKADTPQHGDTFDAIKLNLVRDFQTGVYDYNTMTSVFSRSADFEPVKISFSSAEWCGHVYEELILDPDAVQERYFSYFENETTERALPGEPDGVAEDNLFILLRGLRGPYLQPGETKTVPFLPASFTRRLRHKPLEWTTAEIERAAATERITVPAGEFETFVYEVRVADGRVGKFHLEQDYPHRIVRWSWGVNTPTFAPPEAGEVGELTGTIREAYWKMNGNGQEQVLERIGVKPIVQAGR